ncbi:unnamed protein product [Camellia sinensis]
MQIDWTMVGLVASVHPSVPAMRAENMTRRELIANRLDYTDHVYPFLHMDGLVLLHDKLSARHSCIW